MILTADSFDTLIPGLGQTLTPIAGGDASTQPVAPKTPGATPSAGQGGESSAPVAPRFTAPARPLDTNPGTQIPTTAPAPTNPADAYYNRNADGSVDAVTKDQYDQLTASSLFNGIGTTFKGTAGGDQYDPTHDRWYDPNTIPSGMSASDFFTSSAGDSLTTPGATGAGAPVSWAGRVAGELTTVGGIGGQFVGPADTPIVAGPNGTANPTTQTPSGAATNGTDIGIAAGTTSTSAAGSDAGIASGDSTAVNRLIDLAAAMFAGAGAQGGGSGFSGLVSAPLETGTAVDGTGATASTSKGPLLILVIIVAGLAFWYWKKHHKAG